MSNYEYYEVQKNEVVKAAMSIGMSEQTARKYAERKLRKPDNSPASYHEDTLKGHFSLKGLTMSKNGFKNSRKLKRELEKDVKVKYHPVGCDSIKSVIDHEFGHALDSIYNLRENKDILMLYRELIRKDLIIDSLSEYGEHSIKEFIAESWAEYLNNPEPRRVSVIVGGIIEGYFK